MILHPAEPKDINKMLERQRDDKEMQDYGEKAKREARESWKI